ncbi:hypothetical protein HALLA_08770 [Halostagnicola larsenii XH-48]|uniref:Uncharacterized protein n=1 Tax=Halostagnicola larsenii XH-48 TaxID=797299 RepID=W0JU50_9EURY|nr:hypothetical protein [Halostagnicola larsenii]AHG00812.1 hypothetical protein HALLA_08770 [Halostagnicola larsenii XH-48]
MTERSLIRGSTTTGYFAALTAADGDGRRGGCPDGDHEGVTRSRFRFRVRRFCLRFGLALGLGVGFALGLEDSIRVLVLAVGGVSLAQVRPVALGRVGTRSSAFDPLEDGRS